MNQRNRGNSQIHTNPIAQYKNRQNISNMKCQQSNFNNSDYYFNGNVNDTMIIDDRQKDNSMNNNFMSSDYSQQQQKNFNTKTNQNIGMDNGFTQSIRRPRNFLENNQKNQNMLARNQNSNNFFGHNNTTLGNTNNNPSFN